MRSYHPSSHLTSALAVLVGAHLIATCAAYRSNACQKSYLLLRQGCLELHNGLSNGCCELLAAFNIRGCLLGDAHLLALGLKHARLLQPLEASCSRNAAAAQLRSASAASEQRLLTEAVTLLSDSAPVTDVAQEAVPVLETKIVQGWHTNPNSKSVSLTVRIHGESGPRVVQPAVETVVGLARNAVSTIPEAPLNRQQDQPSSGPQSLPTNPITIDEILAVQYRIEGQGKLCTCVGKTLPVPKDDAGWKTWLNYRYKMARLWLCQVSCKFRWFVAAVVMGQIALLIIWAVVFAFSSAANVNVARRSPKHIEVYAAEDLEWAQPLLSAEEKTKEGND
jgi:hypothetical protein